MTQEPLYRNQEEFEELIRTSEDIRQLGMKAYESVDSERRIKNARLFLEWYNWPAIYTVYGFEIRNIQDNHRFLKWFDEQRLLTGRRQVQRAWSLHAPEKQEDFWEWFNDEKTGKPVFNKQDGRQSTVDSKVRISRTVPVPRSIKNEPKNERPDKG